MRRIILGQAVLDWMCVTFPDEFSGLCGRGIGIQEWTANEWRCVAGVAYTDFNGASISMHVGATVRTWPTADFLWMCFDYPFNQLRCNVVVGVVGEGNERARRLDEHLGFVLQGRIPNGHLTGDLLIYAMTRQQCRYLGLQPKGLRANRARYREREQIAA